MAGYYINREAGRVTVRFPSPPATSIKRELRHADFLSYEQETVWVQPLGPNTVMKAIRAVTAYNQNLTQEIKN